MITRCRLLVLRAPGLLGLATLLSFGCAAPPPPARPLDEAVVRQLDQRAQSGPQLGLRIQRNREGDVRIDNARSMSHGAALTTPLTLTTGPVSAPLRIGDRQATAALCTGLSASFTDEAYAREVDIVPLGNPLKRTSVEGPMFSGFQYLGLARTLRLGSLYIYNVPIGILDDRRGLAALGERPAGCDLVLGIDFLHAFASVTVDFPKRRLVASHAETYTPNMEKLVSAVPMKRGFAVPVVEMLINGEGPFPVLIDTSLNVGLWMPLGMSEMLRVPPDLAPGRSGRRFVPARSVSLTMSEFSAEAVPTVVSRPEFADQDPPYAVLGMAALQPYVVTFDFKHRKLYVESP